MQELLNQVIVIALAAVPALFIADIAVKLHDRFAITQPEAEQNIPDISISDAEILEALASVMPGGVPAEEIEISDAEKEEGEQSSLEEQDQAPQPVEGAADEPAAVGHEQPWLEKFKADRSRILGNRTIRELKSLASESGIPRYSLMTKDQLITALA